MGLDAKMVRKRLEVLLQDPHMVEDYIRRHGPVLDMQKVMALKLQAKQVPGGSGDRGREEDSTYEIKVKCPLCLRSEIPCKELKSKSLSVTYDPFLVPRYAPMKGFEPCNYTLAAVTVCPRCLFASPDKKDFITWSATTRGENKSQIGPFVLNLLKDRQDARIAMLAPGVDAERHFAHPRGLEAAMDSYRLSMHRAICEAELETPFAMYKAGMYSLKIAQLLRDQGRADDDALKESVDLLSQSFRKGELNSPDMEYQLIYLIAALYLRLGDQGQCSAYIGVLDRLKHESDQKAKEGKEPNPKLGVLEHWLEKAKDMFASRDTPDLWKE